MTWLPVVARHYRTVSGNIENWVHLTFAPLALPETERLSSLIIDHEAGMQWVRTEAGTLHILPEQRGRGYSAGYGGGGPTALAEMIHQIVERDGYGISANEAARPLQQGDKAWTWVTSKAADHTQELTLTQLKTLCRTGMVA
ncbi:hypothetical protein AB0H36_41635 [Kribbella sp. NPDC050820]|uniref:hypothetical protein n=1 Tax=Kribbella sp. NPDC050820 TaxID=3155408 RepID=UPI00340619F6